MPRYFYRKGKDLIDAQSNKTLRPSEFGTGKGFKELVAIPGAKYNT